MNSTIYDQTRLKFDYELFGNYLFNIAIFGVGPFETIINIVHMVIVNTNAYESDSKKINYLNYLVLNMFALNLTSFSFFAMINYSNSRVCYILLYISHVFNNWSIYLILLIIFNNYVKQNSQTKSSKKSLFIKNLILLVLSLLIHSPIISIGLLRDHYNSNSTIKTNRLNDCNIFNEYDLILFDLFEFLFLILFPFLFSLCMNTVVSFKLIKSKRNMHAMSISENHAGRQRLINSNQKNANQINIDNQRDKMLNRSIRFILRIYSVNIVGTLLKLPFYLTRLSKHWSYFKLDQSIEIFFLIESITFIIRTIYYVFTFLINLLFNQSFRKQIKQTFNHHK
jgi:hypothetical protein